MHKRIGAVLVGILLFSVAIFIATGAKDTLFLILPFALAGALSPLMLTQQTLLLSAPRGKHAALHYAAGAGAVLLIFLLLLIFFGQIISLPREPSLSARADIALGLGLVFLAPVIILFRRQERAAPKQISLGAKGALGFGSFSMATNFTTLALMIPAAKMIAAGEHVFFERVLFAVFVMILASSPAWFPLALSGLSSAELLLGKLGDFIGSHTREVLGAACLLLGLFLLFKGFL